MKRYLLAWLQRHRKRFLAPHELDAVVEKLTEKEIEGLWRIVQKLDSEHKHDLQQAKNRARLHPWRR